MTAGWEIWFAIPGQWAAYDDIGTEREFVTAVRRRGVSAIGGAQVVVVGGGVTGLSAAWWLARSGAEVLVLDKGVVGWEASGRNGGGASHYHSPLFHEEQRLWPQMDELLGYPTEYRRERVIFALTESDLAAYHGMAAEGRRLGYQADPIDAREVLERVPMANPANLGGVHLHYGGQANPQRTVQAYAWALQDLGGRIAQHTPVIGVVTAGGKAVAVDTPRGRIGLRRPGHRRRATDRHALGQGRGAAAAGPWRGRR